MSTHWKVVPWKAVICALGALVFALAPATANAEEIYFLVGVRHVYRIGPNRDLHMHEREEIEKNYADGVSQDQDTFNQHVANGGDKDKESELLNSDLDALAGDRDKSLGSLYDQCDYMRDRHPELQIQGDGPYQVIGVDFHNQGDTEVVDRYCVYAPWPGYVCDGPCYGGWTWGVWYTPGVFVDLYWGWFDIWPGGRFWGGFWGHGGPFVFGPHGFNDRWHGGKVGGLGRPGFGRGAVSQSSRAAGGHVGNGYTHSGSAYSRSSSSSGSGYGHSSASGTRSSGYAHSSASYHSATSSGSRSSGYSHAGSGRMSSSSSYQGHSGSYSGGGYGRGGTSPSYTHSTGYGSRGASSGSSHAGSSSSSGSGRGSSGSGSGSHGKGR